MNKPTRKPSQDKPYAIVPFSRSSPSLAAPAGQHRYQLSLLHGKLHLAFQVQTPIHVSTGIIVMGSDVGIKNIPLIKTMSRNTDQRLIIQGSSLKGCIRSIYETITNSTLAVVTNKHKNKIPKERLPCKEPKQLCPASRVFGAMNWQGLLKFSDAVCSSTAISNGFMPSLYSPSDKRPGYYAANKKALGRKFYYNMTASVDKGEKYGVSVQQAKELSTFETVLGYKNLTSAELGALLIALGQDSKYPMALKIGGGKPIGMGTMTVVVTKIEPWTDVVDRYRQYEQEPKSHSSYVTAEAVTQFMQEQIRAAHTSELLNQNQLALLAKILAYPGTHEPPDGMY